MVRVPLNYSDERVSSQQMGAFYSHYCLLYCLVQIQICEDFTCSFLLITLKILRIFLQVVSHCKISIKYFMQLGKN